MGNSALKRQISHRLKEGGWEEIRHSGSHAVWAHPNGSTFTLPSTSKDTCRHKLNYLASIARKERGSIEEQQPVIKVAKSLPNIPKRAPMVAEILPEDLVVMVAPVAEVPLVAEPEVPVIPMVVEPEVIPVMKQEEVVPVMKQEEVVPVKIKIPKRVTVKSPSQREQDIQRLAHILAKARLTDQEVHSLVEDMVHSIENVLLGEQK